MWVGWVVFALGAIFRHGGVHEAVTQWSVFGRGFSELRVSWFISNADVNKDTSKNLQCLRWTCHTPFPQI